MVFVANRVEGLSYAEIAKREGMFLWQVKRHMLRAIRIITRDTP
jgi:DNA-directed RNA polymerase specialized sigma24 family protein